MPMKVKINCPKTEEGMQQLYKSVLKTVLYIHKNILSSKELEDIMKKIKK